MSDRQNLTATLKAEARRLGFTLAGACPAAAPLGLDKFHEWLAAGYAGQMHYLAERADAYAHPEHVLAGARSLLMLAFPYRTVEPADCPSGTGRVSRYAWGVDYHHLVRERLNELAAVLSQLAPTATVRGVIDTAPLLEREFAQQAGLGWVGKHTLLLNKSEGSWFFLAALVTSLELEYDSQHETDHCGTCRACLDACPTDAFVEPYVLDPRRCISYLTIELRHPIPEELRSGVGDWLLGCDVCQQVCPWNNKAPRTAEESFLPNDGMNPVDLIGLFDFDEAAFRRRFKRTPLWRPKRRGILRNAAIVLGNQRAVAAIPALTRGLDDAEPLVRGACAWALGQFIAHRENDCADSSLAVRARAALQARLALETDLIVIEELQAAVTLAAD